MRYIVQNLNTCYNRSIYFLFFYVNLRTRNLCHINPFCQYAMVFVDPPKINIGKNSQNWELNSKFFFSDSHSIWLTVTPPDPIHSEIIDLIFIIIINFVLSQSEEEEEMPLECRMKMRNIGRYEHYWLNTVRVHYVNGNFNY